MPAAAGRSWWPERLFAALLVPMACWQIWIFPSLPNYYAQHLLIWPSLAFMLWAWTRGLWSLGGAWSLARPFLPWLAVVLALQTWADWQSAGLYAPDRVGAAVAASLGKLLIQLPFLVFFALLCRVVLRTRANRRALLAGAIATFGVLCLLCIPQGLYVYTAATYWWEHPQPGSPSEQYQSLRAALRLILGHVSPWLEARWPMPGAYDFYANGSYALTLPRINGFFEEASALAAMLAVFFLPLGVGLASAGRVNANRDAPRAWNRARCLGLAVIAASLLLLLLCRSVTGMAAVAIFCLFVLVRGIWEFGQSARQRFAILALIGIIAVAGFAIMGNGLFKDKTTYLEKRLQLLRDKPPPRIVILRDTLEMIAAHPVAGVGRDWYFAHLHEARHFMANLHDPELRLWKRSGSGGELAALPALLAQYGIPVVLAAICFAARVCLRLARLRRQRPRDPLVAFMAAAASLWFVLGLCITMGAVDIRNPLFCLPFFCFLAVAQRTEHARADSLPPDRRGMRHTTASIRQPEG